MLDYKKLFELAKAKGIEDIQISYASETSKEISYVDKELDSFSINSNSHFSAKGLYNGKMGRYSTEVISEGEFETIVDKIIASASLITNEDEEFIYEGDDHYETIKNEYNAELNNIDIKEKIALCEELTSKILSLPYVTHSNAGYSETEVESVMANSKGLSLESHGNIFQVFAEAVVTKDDDTRNNYSLYSSNDFSSINKEKIVNDAYQEAYDSIGAKAIKSGEYEAVLSESATNTLLSVFSGVFSSERSQKGMSILTGRVGEKIGSDAVTIIDNPLLEGSISATPFDTDGVATRYKEVVSNGVFKGFVYNLKTAKKENTKSTGNASGSGCGLFIPYFKPGTHTIKELIASVKDGVYITELQGAHAGANPMSLDFSLQATGFVIKDGKLVSPVALITVSANFLDLLKEVKEVSSELKNTLDATGLLLNKISVSGL